MSFNLNRRDLLVTGGAVATMAIPAAEKTLAQNAPAGALPTSAPAPAAAPGGLPNNEKKINIITLRDLEADAQKIMAPFGYAYVSGARVMNGRCVKTSRHSIAGSSMPTSCPDVLPPTPVRRFSAARSPIRRSPHR